MAQDYTGNLLKATRNLFAILRLDKKDISSIYFFALMAGLISLTLPLGIQTIISFVMAGSISASIVVLIVIVVVGVFLNGLVQLRQMQVIEKVEQKIFTRYTLEFSDRLPKLNIEKLDNYYLPELVNRFFDTASLAKGIEKILLDVPAAVIQIVFGLILLAFYHPVFIGFGAILIFIVIIIIRFTSPQGLATSLRASDYKYAIAGWLEEMARVIKSFKYTKSTSLHMKKSDELITNYLEARTSHFKILLLQFWSLVTFKIIITAAMLIVGAVLLVDQQINVGQFIAADIVILAIISSVEKLIASLDKVYDTLTSIEKLNKVIESEIEHGGSIVLPNNNNGVSIQFTNVNFSYNQNQQVLQNINLSIIQGSFVCIAGESGSGKSSLLRLLTGAFKNFEGSILIDDVPISNYNLNSLRSQTGILLSQQDIFQGTLMENITMGNEEVSADEVAELTEKTGLKDFIQSNKQGFDTILDPLGKRLPSKVRQNILLMRALLGKHRLLLLEEPFSHLDQKQKEAVLSFLKNDKLATIIITSEDESVAAGCDMVIKLENGKII